MDREDFSEYRFAKCIIGIEPIGVNNSQQITTRGGFPRRFKTKKTVQFEKDFLKQFDYYIERFFKLSSLQNELKCPVHVNIILKKPIYKKDTNVISKKSIDIDGPVKILLDLVCGAVSMDDAFITRLTVEKVHSLIPQIEIDFSLVYS